MARIFLLLGWRSGPASLACGARRARATAWPGEQADGTCVKEGGLGLNVFTTNSAKHTKSEVLKEN